MSIPSRCVDTPSPILVRHVQIDTLPKQHRRTLRMAIEGRNMHQGAAILCALINAGSELVRQQFDHVRVTVFRRQVHRRSVLIVGDCGRGSDSIKVLYQPLVPLCRSYVQRSLAVPVLGVHVGPVVHQNAHHVHIAPSGRQMQRRVPIRSGGLGGF